MNGAFHSCGPRGSFAKKPFPGGALQVASFHTVAWSVVVTFLISLMVLLRFYLAAVIERSTPQCPSRCVESLKATRVKNLKNPSLKRQAGLYAYQKSPRNSFVL